MRSCCMRLSPLLCLLFSAPDKSVSKIEMYCKYLLLICHLKSLMDTKNAIRKAGIFPSFPVQFCCIDSKTTSLFIDHYFIQSVSVN